MSLSAFFPEVLAPPPGGIPDALSLAEKYKPRQIDEFIGLDKARRQLASFVRAPRMVGGLLFYGAAGTGKTSMAYALARELRAEVHHIPARTCDLDTITRVRYSCNFVPMSGYRRHVVLVDEADLMSQPAQDYLLSELDGTDATPETKFIFTCNATDRFERRFLERNLKFQFSSHGKSKDIAAHLERVWDEETGNAEPRPDFVRLVKEANNSIRESLQSLEMEIMAL